MVNYFHFWWQVSHICPLSETIIKLDRQCFLMIWQLWNDVVKAVLLETGHKQAWPQLVTRLVTLLAFLGHIPWFYNFWSHHNCRNRAKQANECLPLHKYPTVGRAVGSVVKFRTKGTLNLFKAHVVALNFFLSGRLQFTIVLYSRSSARFFVRYVAR